jgi:glycine oxidase
VRPVKGQILRLRASAPPAERLVRGLRCYVVARPDGEVVVGATTEERGYDRTVTAGGVFALLEAARELLPDVDELELVEVSAGLRPATPDNAPIVGEGATTGLVWAAGHHRAGVLLSPLTAEAVVAALLGERGPEAMRPFGPARFEPPRGSGAGLGEPRRLEPLGTRGR